MRKLILNMEPEDKTLSDLDALVGALRRLKEVNNEAYKKKLERIKGDALEQIRSSTSDEERSRYVHKLNVICGAEKIIEGIKPVQGNYESHPEQDSRFEDLVIQNKADPSPKSPARTKAAYLALAGGASVGIAYFLWRNYPSNLEGLIDKIF